MAETKNPTIDFARRQALGALSSLGAASLLGCDASRSQAAEALETCVLTPTETAGPFPLLSVLSDSRFLRADITEGQPGVPLNLTLEVVDVGRKCLPMAGAAVYVWHCSKEGAYSGYEQGAQGNHRGQTWLRGLQLTDGRGRASFRTIYPGWYPGRVTHIHFQVYIGDRQRGRATATSQLVFPDEVTAAVYAAPAYAARGQNSTVKRIADDFLFADGYEHQLAQITGNPAAGYTASLTVGVAA
jgi:protocatechuate 3,4-dioxygenase beta subunit